MTIIKDDYGNFVAVKRVLQYRSDSVICEVVNNYPGCVNGWHLSDKKCWNFSIDCYISQTRKTMEIE